MTIDIMSELTLTWGLSGAKGGPDESRTLFKEITAGKKNNSCYAFYKVEHVFQILSKTAA